MNRKHVMGIAASVLVLLGVFWGVGKMVSNPAQSGGQIGASSGDKWKVSEGRSPMDDSKTVTLSLDADNLISGAVRTERPSLHIRCKVDKGEYRTWAYIWTGMAADRATYLSDILDKPKVRIRLDDGEASGTWWSESSAHDALFPPRRWDRICEGAGQSQDTPVRIHTLSGKPGCGSLRPARVGQSLKCDRRGLSLAR